MTDPAQIAKSLSEAQISVILNGGPVANSVCNYETLRNIGLVSRGLSCQYLTPLGLAVRAILDKETP